MRRLLRIGCPATVAFAVACAIPERDNPNDPANSPRAGLAVYVGTAGGPNIGRRSDVFVLDASGSHDPLDRGPLRFEWDVDGVDDFEETDPPTCASPAETAALPCVTTCGQPQVPGACLRARLVVTSADLPARVGTVEREVRVRAVEAGGRFFDDASVSAFVRNEAPVVEMGEDLFVPDLTEETEVHLSACGGRTGPCSSFDPDGDPVVWSWTRLRGDPVLPAVSTGSAYLFTAPSREQSMLFELRASDGLAETVGLVRVHVGSQLWLTTIDPTVVWRLYGDFRSARTYYPNYVAGTSGAPETSLPEGGVAVGEDDRVWVGISFLDTAGLLVRGDVELLEADPAGLSPVDSWSQAGAFVPTSIAPSGSGACAVFRTHTDPDEGESFSPPSFFARLVPGSGVASGPTSLDLGEEPKYVLPRPSGECWAVTGALPEAPAGASVYRQSGTALTPVALDVLDDVTASTMTPDGSLWIAGPDPSCAGGAVERYPVSGGGERVACHPRSVDGIAAHPDGGVWIHDAESQEVWRVTEDGAATLTDAPLVGLPADGFFPRGEPSFVSDPVARDLWSIDGFQERIGRFTADADGSFRDVAFAESERLRFDFGGFGSFSTVAIDPGRGRAIAPVISPGYGGTVVQVPAHLRIAERVFISSPFVSVAPEPTRGDAWVSDNGATLGSLRRLTLAGEVQATTALGGAAFHSAAQSDGGTWVAISTPDGGRLTRVSRDGEVLASWSPPSGLPVTGVAGREEDGFLCALAESEDFSSSELIRLDLDDPQTTVPQPGGAGGRAVRATADGCWFAFIDGSIFHFDGTTPQALPGGPFPNAFSLDVDFDGSAWFLSDVGIRSAPPGGPAVARLPEFVDGDGEPIAANAINLQRRCIPGSCSAADPLHVWIWSSTSVYRLDDDGNTLQVYDVPFIGNITGLEILP